MNLFRPPLLRQRAQAFTLLELTIVIMVLLALIGMGLSGSGSIRNWQLGREASETLRSVYTAQRLYLSDNPTAAVSELATEANKDKLIPYLPSRATAMPTVKSLTGTALQIKFNVFPPVVNDGSGGTYDPSGCATDSLWDVGE
jgi:type II secretory pathway pseudopilin PulG